MRRLNHFMKAFKNNAEAHQQSHEAVRLLDEVSKSQIIDRYTHQDSFAELRYATVRDFCDSADHLPQICYLNGDLKNVQRPWIIKAILNKVPLGGKLLEIGGGIPLVAGMLAELGYQVTLVDPYEGAGNGPTEYEKYVQQFPHINIVKSTFGVDFNGDNPASFDCIYSVSVLEHIPHEGIKDIYEGIHKFLRPGGFSIHCVDNVIQGSGTQFHEDTVRLVLHQQKQLKEPNCDSENEYDELLIQLKDDLETFYLSATGHHLWRGGKLYEDFPFRKVVSIQTCEQSS